MKCDDVLLARVSRSEEIGEAEMFSGGLSREREPYFPVLIVDDQIVSLRLALEITINDFRHKQLFALRPFLNLLVNRPHFLAHQRLIVFNRHSPLLELPLTFE